jgi:hypothetical protein
LDEKRAGTIGIDNSIKKPIWTRIENHFEEKSGIHYDRQQLQTAVNNLKKNSKRLKIVKTILGLVGILIKRSQPLQIMYGFIISKVILWQGSFVIHLYHYMTSCLSILVEQSLLENMQEDHRNRGSYQFQ